MKIKSLTAILLLATHSSTMAQNTDSPKVKLKKKLDDACNKFKLDLEQKMADKTHLLYKVIDQELKIIKASTLDEKCKDEDLIKNSIIGIEHEGKACYIKDKIEKIEKGGYVALEKNFLRSDYQSYLKPYEIVVEDDRVLYAISIENVSEEVANTLILKATDPSFTLFALGDKEVPDFHRALFSLDHRNHPDKIPFKIMSTAISNDADLTQEEQKYFLKHLKEDKNGYVKASKTLEKPLLEALKSISHDCWDGKGNIVKGLSLTGTSSYVFQKWDVSPLKQWIADNKKDEL